MSLAQRQVNQPVNALKMRYKLKAGTIAFMGLALTLGTMKMGFQPPEPSDPASKTNLARSPTLMRLEKLKREEGAGGAAGESSKETSAEADEAEKEVP